MARINKQLLERIANKKGVNPKAIYPLITDIVHETFLERDQAALVLASRLHIPIQKYSTEAQRLAVRAYLGGAQINRANIPPPPPAPEVEGKPARRRGNARLPAKQKPAKQNDNSVFVIHGRDIALRNSLFSFLSALGCKPVEFKQAVSKVKGTQNPYVGSILDTVFAKTQALIVLFSPDDEVKLKDHFVKKGEKSTEGRLRSQARANVLFEAGMVMSRHQEKTIMVQVGELKSFSDIGGRLMLHLDNSQESRNDLVNRLERICKVDRTGDLWMSVGDFKPASGKKPKKNAKRAS